MSTTPPALIPTVPTPAHPTPNLGRQVLNFWFAAADPTTMGFIRIVTGCLILYTHLAYSFDLQNFFGKDSWYDTQSINRERREMPQSAPTLDWEDPTFPQQLPQLPEYPHRRKVWMAYLRANVTPETTTAEIDAKLAYLERLLKYDEEQMRNRIGEARYTWEGIAYLSNLSSNATDRTNQLAVLLDESQRASRSASRIPKLEIPPTPSAVGLMSGPDRATFAKEAEACFVSLPVDPNDRAYILVHYSESTYGQRKALLGFIRGLTKLSATERDWQLRYIEYWNVDPNICIRFGSSIFSLWFHITDPTEMVIAHCAMLVVFVCFTLGLWTRVTSVLTWLAILTYIHRSHQTLFGMDTMMNILALYLMIGNSGAALSVDRVLNRYRASRASLSRSGTIDPATQIYLDNPPYSVASGFALRMLQVHFCFIYMASGLAKLKGAAWWNTNAYWDTLVNPEFTMVYYQWYEMMLRHLVANRPLYAVVAAIGVAFTFIAEIGLPFLVWTRVRPYIVMFGLLLHTGIGLFMGLVVFSLFMMTMLLGYIPGVAIRERLFGPSPTTGRLKLRYDPTSIEQQRAVAWIRTFDFENRIDANQTGPATVLQLESDGKSLTSHAAVKVLFAKLSWLSMFRWLLFVPGLSKVINNAFAGNAPVKEVAKAVASR